MIHMDTDDKVISDIAIGYFIRFFVAQEKMRQFQTRTWSGKPDRSHDFARRN